MAAGARIPAFSFLLSVMSDIQVSFPSKERDGNKTLTGWVE